MTTEPVLSVRRGRPTDDDVAALVIAMALLTSKRDHPEDERTRARWARPARYWMPGSWTRHHPE
jgi:hypothetical protein